MSGLSIHLEGSKYVVRNMARSTEEVDAGTGAEGKKVSSHSTRVAASSAIADLEMKQAREVAIAAAKELLGV